jgi:hypothetical protein
MSYGLLLTQSRLALTPAAARAMALSEATSAVARPEMAEQRVYRALDPVPGAALVQYFAGAAPTLTADASDLHRYRCRELSDSGAVSEEAPVLVMVAFDVPPERASTVERWYIEEHIPLLCRAPGWLRARRYEMLSWSGGPRYTSIALHELRSVSVLDSAERQYARSTAWRAALVAEPWFAAAGRFIYERVTAEVLHEQ